MDSPMATLMFCWYKTGLILPYGLWYLNLVFGHPHLWDKSSMVRLDCQRVYGHQPMVQRPVDLVLGKQDPAGSSDRTGSEAPMVQVTDQGFDISRNFRVPVTLRAGLRVCPERNELRLEEAYFTAQAQFMTLVHLGVTMFHVKFSEKSVGKEPAADFMHVGLFPFFAFLELYKSEMKP